MKTLPRREFLAGTAVAGATFCLTGRLSAAPAGKQKTFTILHTNDMHSAFIGMGPAADYTPFTLNDDQTRGGYARLGALVARRKEARKVQGPVLVLDAGDYSMGTAFSAATRETGGELQLMSRMGYDATTFGNHEFDLGPDGLGKSIGMAAKAGRIPAVLASNTDFAKEDATLAGIQRLAKEGVTAAVFASRGYSIDQPLAVAPRDLPNTFADIAAGTPLASLVTDAFRTATKADIGFNANEVRAIKVG